MSVIVVDLMLEVKGEMVKRRGKGRKIKIGRRKRRSKIFFIVFWMSECDLEIRFDHRLKFYLYLIGGKGRDILQQVKKKSYLFILQFWNLKLCYFSNILFQIPIYYINIYLYIYFQFPMCFTVCFEFWINLLKL